MIHPTAIIAPGAQIHPTCTIGPYCTVGDQVTLGEGVHLISHVALTGKTTVGPLCKIFPFASIGQPAQYIKGALSADAEIIIGQGCTIREHVTISPGTPDHGNRTLIGDQCLLMIGSHVGHDCVVGNNVLLTNNASLGGHCLIGDGAIIGALSGIHQFVRIGPRAIIGAMSGVENDVIPYGSVWGNRARLHGLNLVGLKRGGFNRATIHDMRNAYRLLFAEEGTLAERLSDVRETFAGNILVMEIVGFMEAPSPREICLPPFQNDPR